MTFLREAAAENDPILAEVSICDTCAKRIGGTAPKDRISGGWIATCMICSEPRYCAHVRDYRWPGGKRPTRAAPP
jgi:hypothetical protein